MPAFGPSLHRETASITTAADGTATVALSGKPSGFLVGWNANSGTLDDGATSTWDFTLTSGVSDADLLATLGTNVPVADEFIWFDGNNTPLRIPVHSSEQLTVNVTNGGDTKTGTLYLYFERNP